MSCKGSSTVWPRRWILPVTAAVGVVLVVGLAPLWPMVTISAEGRTIAAINAETMTLRYVHSIDNLPIEEDLRVTDDRSFSVERTRLRQFGAGMGQIEGEGKGYSDGEWWVIDDLNRDIGDQLHIRAGAPDIDHRLSIATTEYALSACLPGERFTLSAERISLLEILLTHDAPQCRTTLTATLTSRAHL